MIVYAFRFQPFASRAGQDDVIGLQFTYSAALVHVIKEALARYKGLAANSARHISTAGGWLPETKTWFVERSMWVLVHTELVRVGATIEEIPRPATVPHYPASGGHLVDEARRLGLQLLPKEQEEREPLPGMRAVASSAADELVRAAVNVVAAPTHRLADTVERRGRN